MVVIRGSQYGCAAGRQALQRFLTSRTSSTARRTCACDFGVQQRPMAVTWESL